MTRTRSRPGWSAGTRSPHGLRTGGVEGFIAAYDLSRLAPAWREAAERGLRQRMSAHAHPLAVADALSAVPRSRPFETWASLERVSVPTVVVGSRDDADPEHPLAVARAYAQAIPGARLEVEDEGASPIAWQGGRLSRLLLELASSAMPPRPEPPAFRSALLEF